MGPRSDYLILGGGTAGCVLAGRLTEVAGTTVRLVEAGPDYGPFIASRWPGDLLDGAEIATSHGWGFNDSEESAFRARVIGGCSSVNASMIVRPTPADLDEWAEAAGDDRWRAPAFGKQLARAETTLRARLPGADERSALGEAMIAAAARIGLPRVERLNADPASIGIGRVPVNAVGQTRWNAAFAYLDAARRRPGLEIIPDALVDRVVVDGGRAVGALVLAGGRETLVEAGTVIVAAGAYGSPAVLLRSGIGDPEVLARIGAPIVVEAPGVGRRLRDHPGVMLAAELTSAATDRVRAAADRSRMRSSWPGPGATQLHQTRSISTSCSRPRQVQMTMPVA